MAGGPEPNRAGGLATFTQNCEVALMLGDRKVGTATLMGPLPGRDEGAFCRFLHGLPLSQYARSQEELVGIRDVRISDTVEMQRYPYRYGGVESPPEFLKGLRIGFHSWDLRRLLPLQCCSSAEQNQQCRSAVEIPHRHFQTEVEGEEISDEIRPAVETVAHGVPLRVVRKSPRLRRNSGINIAGTTIAGNSQGSQSQPGGTQVFEDEDNTQSISSESSSSGSDYLAKGNRGVTEQALIRRNGVEFDEMLSSPRHKRKYNFVTRVQKQEKEDSTLLVKRQKLASSLTADKLRSMKCCLTRRCFQSADVSFLQAQSVRILAMKQPDRKFVLQRMLNPTKQKYFFNEKQVCASFLERAFGFSRYLQARVKGTAGSVRLYNPREEEGSSETNQRDAVICYLDRLAESVGDVMPDSLEVHLPYFQKDHVYADFCQEFNTLHPEKSRSVPSKTYFLSIWKAHCSQIKIRKHHRFTKCGDCERMRVALEDRGTDLKAAQAIREKKKVHNEMIAKERREYMKKSQKAVLYPSDYCSIIVDGADQSAYGIPHFRVKVKEERGHAMTVRLIGVLEHGPRKFVSLYLMTEQYETGANHIIEVIHRHLTLRSLRTPLPRTLFVQLDNCHRENKNQYIFAYFESLVAWGVFCEVFVSFLPIGHTHADIDQVFSRTSLRLKQNDAVTMDEMIQELCKSYTPQPVVVYMKGVINFSGLCANTKCSAAVQGFTTYRYFHFARASDSSRGKGRFYKTTCSVRVSCTDEWAKLENPSKRGFLTKVPNLSLTSPTKTKCPSNRDEINRRLESEEARILRSRMKALHDLRDEVYRSEEQPLHWNLRDCIELNGRYARADSTNGQDIDSESTVSLRAEADLEYEINDFVATRNRSEDERVPFWIARVLATLKNEEGQIVRLKIRWCEMYDGSTAAKGKYRPSDFGKGKTKRPWIVTISVNTVIHRFSTLSREKKLYVRDQKSIWQSLH